ncbi:MAG: V-type ATP synthase subunit E [Chromatiales bacterium]|nr:V-type ATP synthase subunit E [Chromatiales bacterium]
MNGQDAVEELQAALMQRAQALAEEHRARGRQGRERVIREESERLRLREDREVLAAKELAERTLRRQVQARELRLQGDLDRLRWEMVESVLQGLPQRLEQFAGDEQRYFDFLGALLARAADALKGRDLVVELNRHDAERLRPRWDEFVATHAPGVRVSLSPEPATGMGGLVVRGKENRVRIDNSFEGRLERLRPDLAQIIIERLFAYDVKSGVGNHG